MQSRSFRVRIKGSKGEPELAAEITKRFCNISQQARQSRILFNEVNLIFYGSDYVCTYMHQAPPLAHLFMVDIFLGMLWLSKIISMSLISCSVFVNFERKSETEFVSGFLFGLEK